MICSKLGFCSAKLPNFCHNLRLPILIVTTLLHHLIELVLSLVPQRKKKSLCLLSGFCYKDLAGREVFLLFQKFITAVCQYFEIRTEKDMKY